MNGEDIDAIHRIGNGAIVDLDKAIQTLKQMRQVRAEHRAIIAFKPKQRVSFKREGQIVFGFIQEANDPGKVHVVSADNAATHILDPFVVETT
jgi:hypothetical protein